MYTPASCRSWRCRGGGSAGSHLLRLEAPHRQCAPAVLNIDKQHLLLYKWMAHDLQQHCKLCSEITVIPSSVSILAMSVSTFTAQRCARHIRGRTIFLQLHGVLSVNVIACSSRACRTGSAHVRRGAVRASAATDDLDITKVWRHSHWELPNSANKNALALITQLTLYNSLLRSLTPLLHVITAHVSNALQMSPLADRILVKPTEQDNVRGSLAAAVPYPWQFFCSTAVRRSGQA